MPSLSDLIRAVPGAVLTHGSPERAVCAVRDRHDELGPDDVFVAIRGARVDSHDHVSRLPAHIAAVVVERPVTAPSGVAVVRVPSTVLALAPLAARALGSPAATLPVVGVTGTNGKTSTTFLLADIARAAGLVPGVVGTTGHYVGARRIPSTHTSPSAPTVQALLADMKAAGVGLVAMEASSIGLAAHRCDAIPFRAAVFTNLTRDHLDWHGTMEAYAAAKGRLFHELLEGRAILNADDPAHAQFRPANRPVWTYSMQDRADVRAELVQSDAHGLMADVFTPAGSGPLSLPLVGRHNLQNALGALAAALALEVPLAAALAGLSASVGAPGRLERVVNSRGFSVFVDYAHTDDALARVLTELRALGPKRILTVFGCGGDRDRGKRPLMGAAAAAGSDLCVVTSDNPRSEDPLAILADILPGLGGAAHVVEPDRRAAIHLAIARAQPGDVVLIAGKGHEDYQEIGGEKLPFDDRAVAREVL